MCVSKIMYRKKKGKYVFTLNKKKIEKEKRKVQLIEHVLFAELFPRFTGFEGFDRRGELFI